MLPDGSIVDSAMLPEGSVQEDTIALTSEGLRHSLQPDSSSSNRYSLPGRGLRTAPPRETESRRLQRFEQAMMASDPLEVESAALRSIQRNLDQSGGHIVQYHPVVTGAVPLTLSSSSID